MLKKTGIGVVVKQQIIQGKHKVLHILSEHGRWSGIYPFNTHAIDLLTETEFMWTGKSIESLGMHQCYNITHFLPMELLSEQFIHNSQSQDNQYSENKQNSQSMQSNKENTKHVLIQRDLTQKDSDNSKNSDNNNSSVDISDNEKGNNTSALYNTTKNDNANSNSLNNTNRAIDKHANNHQIYLVAITLCELAMLMPERQADKELWYHFKHARELLMQASILQESIQSFAVQSSTMQSSLQATRSSLQSSKIVTDISISLPISTVNSSFAQKSLHTNSDINAETHIYIDDIKDYNTQEQNTLDNNKINNSLNNNHSAHDNTSLQIEAWMRFEAALLDIIITPKHINNPKEFFKQSTILLNMQYPDIKFFRARNYLYKTL